MQDLDFLPLDYRQRHMRRQSQPWRVIVVAVFVALVIAAAYSQHKHKCAVEEDLAALVPQYELAVSQCDKLANTQSQLQKIQTSAELFTCLRHPWPQTQLLAAVLRALPDQITLQTLRISRETPAGQVPTERRSRFERQTKQEDIAKLSPAECDLKQLRDEFDNMQTLVFISGTTSDSAALHRYLGRLNNTSLFQKAELDSSESVQGDRGGKLRFEAILVVRPGYGQPGGPAGPKRRAVAQTIPKSNIRPLR